MRKWIWIGSALLGLVLLGALGFTYYVYQDSRSLFAQDKERVDNAVKAMDAEDLQAPTLYRQADSMVRLTGGLAFVSAGEVQELRERLEKSRAAARKRKPAQVVLWRLGSHYTWTLFKFQFSDNKDEVENSLLRYQYLAWLLDLTGNFSPYLDRTQVPVLKKGFVRGRLDDFTKQVEAKYGAENGKRFRMASVAVLALLAVQGQDVFPEASPGYGEELGRLGEELRLPEKLWAPYVEGLQNRLPREELAQRLATFENGISDYLASGVKAEPPPPPRPRADPSSDNQPLPEALVESWKQAGASAGWLERGKYPFTIRYPGGTGGKPGEIASFEFYKWDSKAIANLPMPEQRFALVLPFDCYPNFKQLQKFHYLHTLRLSLTYLDDESLKFLTQLPELQELFLNSSTISEKGLKELAKCKELHMLYLYKCGSGRGLGELAALQHLQWLYLGGNRGLSAQDRQGLTELGKLTHLQTLFLQHCEVDNAGLKELANLKQLRQLNLDGNKLTDAALKTLAGFEQLQGLHLSENDIGDYGLRELASLTQLQELDLNRTKVVGFAFEDLSGLTQLHSLDMGSTPLTDDGIKPLARFKSLRTLRVGGTRITDAGMKALAGLTQLQSLYLSSTKVGDAGLAELANLKDLRVLNLWSTPVGDAGLKELANFKELRDLCLARTKITDAGLKHLAALTNLEQLELGSKQVTDAGLQDLAALRSVKVLKLNGTGVTEKGVEKLRRALPDAKISSFESI